MGGHAIKDSSLGACPKTAFRGRFCFVLYTLLGEGRHGVMLCARVHPHGIGGTLMAGGLFPQARPTPTITDAWILFRPGTLG